ncbi:MAG: hypothetical protein RMK18_11395 [Armatimonadota bacterium]|nr:hypothetical protein [Armatimonadota bacterium]MDW8026453.1 hypothetical protein [Armatimonadota bacterium]
MAKSLITFAIAFAIPLVALLSHPELKRVLIWDVISFGFSSHLQTMEYMPKPSEPLYRSFGEIERSGCTRKKWLGCEKICQKTGKVWIGIFGLRYAMNEVQLNRTEETGKLPLSSTMQTDIAVAERLLRLATELSERDSENAFPMLAKSYALFALRRDDEALAAFHEAAMRPNYDAYDSKYLQLILPKCLTCEERVLIMLMHISPHLDRIRSLSRMVMRHSAQAEKEGNSERALMLAEDVIKVGGKMRDKGFLYLDTLTGIKLQQIAFVGRTRKIERKYNDKCKIVLEEGLKFAMFAYEHSYHELAKWALNEAWKSAQTLYLLDLWRWYHDDSFLPNFTTKEMCWLNIARSIGFTLLFTMALLLALAFLTFAVLWKLPASTDRYPTITAVFIVSSLPISLIFCGVSPKLIRVPEPVLLALGIQNFMAYLISPIVVLFLISVCLLPPLLQFRREVNWHFILFLTGVFAFLCAAAFACISTLYDIEINMLYFESLLLLAFIGFLLTALFIWRQKFPKVFPKILQKAVKPSLLLFTFLTLAVFLISLASESVRLLLEEDIRSLIISLTFSLPLVSVIAFISLFLFAVFIACFVWSRFEHPERKGIYQSALARLRNATILLALIFWWGYATVQFSNLPLRAKLHRAIDSIIAYGEPNIIKHKVNLMLQRR